MVGNYIGKNTYCMLMCELSSLHANFSPKLCISEDTEYTVSPKLFYFLTFISKFMYILQLCYTKQTTVLLPRLKYSHVARNDFTLYTHLYGEIYRTVVDIKF